jgi:protein SHQ1
MPLTPQFELSQSDTEVIVTVFVPTIRITNIEVLLEDSTLHFYASPYLLKLNFAPHEFAPDAEGIVSAHYIPSTQTVRIPLVKAERGVEWPHLDLTARLLRPQEIPKQWLHSVETETETPLLHQPDMSTKTTEHKTDSESTADYDSSAIVFGYGFGNIFQNIFSDYCRGGLAHEMLQLPDPENTSPEQRRKQRLEKEDTTFDPDRYLQDLHIEEDYMYPMVMDFVPFWNQRDTEADMPHEANIGDRDKPDNQKADSHKADSHKANGPSDDPDLAQKLQKQLNLNLNPNSPSTVNHNQAFTSDEKLQLSTIPYPLIPRRLLCNHCSLWCGLLDLLVPFVYDHLMTLGDPTVESAWTITTLSNSLSWLDPPETVNDAVISLSRRMLIYPYWRNWEFVTNVWKHTLCILKQGIHSAIKSLLQVRNILEKSESYYVGNKLFVDPYLYWIQQQQYEDSTFLVEGLHQVLRETEKVKVELGLDLIQYESMLEEDSDDSESGVDGDSSEDKEDSESDSESELDTEDKNNPTEVDDPASTEFHKVDASNALLDSEEGNGNSLFEIVEAQESTKNVEENTDADDTCTTYGTGTTTGQRNPLIQEM